MKGHKAHHHGVKHHGVHHKHPRAAHKDGGVAEYKMDKAPKEVYAGAGSNVVHEAEEHKWGGHVKHKRGGKATKHVGHVHGHHAAHHAGRKPRKTGGKVGSDSHPLSSAHKGTAPKGRHEMEID